MIASRLLRGAIFSSPRLHWLFAPVPTYSLVAFRVVFGPTMLWEVRRYFKTTGSPNTE